MAEINSYGTITPAAGQFVPVQDMGGTGSKIDIGALVYSILAGAGISVDVATGPVTITATGAGLLPLVGGTMSGVIDMGTNKITSLATPTNTADAATKAYVDDKIGYWQSETYTPGGATVNNLALASALSIVVNIAASVETTITGMAAPTAADRIRLLINASSKPVVFTIQDSGSSAANRFNTAAPDAGSAKPLVLLGREALLVQYTSSRWMSLGIFDLKLRIDRPITTAGLIVDAAYKVSASGPFDKLTTAAFAFRGIEAVSPNQYNWKIQELYNATGGSVTIEHNAMPGGSSPVAYGILTSTAANVTWPSKTAARFIYDYGQSRWLLLNTPA